MDAGLTDDGIALNLCRNVGGSQRQPILWLKRQFNGQPLGGKLVAVAVDAREAYFAGDPLFQRTNAGWQRPRLRIDRTADRLDKGKGDAIDLGIFNGERINLDRAVGSIDLALFGRVAHPTQAAAD